MVNNIIASARAQIEYIDMYNLNDHSIRFSTETNQLLVMPVTGAGNLYVPFSYYGLEVKIVHNNMELHGL